MRRLVPTLAVCLGIGLTGCPDPDPATQVLVVFEADRAVRQVARDIEIVAYGGPRGQSFPRENRQSLRLNIEDIGGWPVTHTVVPADNDATRLYQIDGNIFNADDQPIGHVRAISSYLERRTLVLTLRFYSNCLYLEPCATDDYSCDANGDCQVARINPEGLPDLGDGGVGMLPDAGTEPVCTTALDCDDGVACTIDACTDDGCVNREEDSLCTGMPGGRCNALLGCQYSDPGGCAAANCLPEPCERNAECNDDGECEREWGCEFAQECCGGMCTTCNDGNACTASRCDEAAGECVHDATAGSCDNGVLCDGIEVCVDGECTSPGDPCPGSSTCDPATDMCTGCASDADCPPAYVDPSSPDCVAIGDTCDPAGEAYQESVTFSCDAGTCVERRMPAPSSCMVEGLDGISCGSSMEVPIEMCHVAEGGDRCDFEGEQAFRSTIPQCMDGRCEDLGAGGTTIRSCSLTPPMDCFVIETGPPEGGMDAEAGTDSSTEGGTDSSTDSETGTDSSMDSETGTDTSTGDSGCTPFPEDCRNSMDDDCDRLVDCDDPDCDIECGLGDVGPPDVAI